MVGVGIVAVGVGVGVLVSVGVEDGVADGAADGVADGVVEGVGEVVTLDASCRELRNTFADSSFCTGASGVDVV